MSNPKLLLVLFLACFTAFGQKAESASMAISLNAPTTIPIVFINTISAKTSHAGDLVSARTTQIVRLADGVVIPQGARITGHVVATNPFIYDKTPYARQKRSVLSLHFDSIEVAQRTLPLDVTVRAMASPITSKDAQTPINHDIDTSGETTQIGGDQRYPWNAPVVDTDGNVVAYSRHGGVYAHLIANGICDGSTVEVSVGIYSASACGLYGFVETSAEETGTISTPSTLTLVSTRISPKLWKNSTALLEVLPHPETVASR